MHPVATLIAALLLLVCFGTSTTHWNGLLLVEASSGDRLDFFNLCITDCYAEICAGEPDSMHSVPLQLRLFRWSCRDNCQYNCMHMTTTVTIKEHNDDPQKHPRAVHQFFGKWPFTRLLGIQEPASVLFSILNGWAHYKGMRRMQANTPAWLPLRPLLIMNGVLAVISWVWSVVFHTRDKAWTEHLDYFGAMLSITWSLYVSIYRAFSFHKPERATLRLVTLFGLLGYYAVHVLYLSLYKFDYGYNTIVGVIMGLGSVVFWGIWTYRNRRPYSWRIMACMFAIMSAMALEVLDFAPIFWIIDAHALWHFTTIFIVPMYWDFLTQDALWETKLVKGKGEILY